MGNNEENPFTPFKMTYVYDATDEWGAKPWNATAKKCSETYDVGSIELNALKASLNVSYYLFLICFILTLSLYFVRTYQQPAAASTVPYRVPSQSGILI